MLKKGIHLKPINLLVCNFRWVAELLSIRHLFRHRVSKKQTALLCVTLNNPVSNFKNRSGLVRCTNSLKEIQIYCWDQE